jgi:carbonic anhydrase
MGFLGQVLLLRFSHLFNNSFPNPVRPILALLIVTAFLARCQQPSSEQHSPLEKLIAGNTRFAAGKPTHPDETLERIRDLKRGQHPFAIVVSCSDSRVPPELVFDQGFGDIFTIRTAGNVIGDYELGSIEYAVEHLGCELVIILGHTQCGAIQSFIETDGKYHHFDHIKSIIDYIEGEEEEKELRATGHLNIEAAVIANIHHGVNLVKSSNPILKPLVDAKKLTVIGALYHLEDGVVTFETDTAHPLH